MQSFRHQRRGDGRTSEVFPDPPSEAGGGIALRKRQQHPRHPDREDPADARHRAGRVTAHEGGERPREGERLREVRREHEEEEQDAHG